MAQGRKVDMKVVMLGRQAVGKSALVDRFMNDRWSPAENATTIGGSFCAREVKVDPALVPAAAASARASVAPATVLCGVWDTAGSERYESLTRHYFSQAESAFCCFDLTDLSSWEKVAFWIAELHKVEPSCRVYVIGCKADLIQPNQGTQATSRARGGTSASGSSGVQRTRCISKEAVLQFCATIEPPAEYFETSSLTGVGIQHAFQTAAADWLAKPKKEHDFGAISLDDRDDRRRRRGVTAPCCNQ